MKSLFNKIIENLKLLAWIFFRPKKFFTHISKRISLTIPIVILITILMGPIFAIKRFPILKSRTIEWSATSSLFSAIFVGSVGICILILGLVLESLVILLTARLLKGKIKFKSLFFALLYCMWPPWLVEFGIFLLFPALITSVFPDLISIILDVWEVILSIIAVSVLFNFSYKKSIGVFLPWALIRFLLFSL